MVDSVPMTDKNRIDLLNQRLTENINPSKVVTIDLQSPNQQNMSEFEDNTSKSRTNDLFLHHQHVQVIHEIHDENSKSKSKHGLDDGAKDHTPKRPKGEDGQDNGVKTNPGAGMRKIASYFSQQSDGSGGDNAEKPAKKTAKTPKAAVDAQSTSSTTTDRIPNDVKKYVESLKHTKDQAESKVQRLERERDIANEKTKELDSINTKLFSTLELAYRQTAQQEARSRRDRLAANSVRLGKIALTRSGTGHPMILEQWEEGYALNELKVREAALEKRKKELDDRKKRLQGVKRSHNKKSAAEPLNDDDSSHEFGGNLIDLDITAEESAIKSHFDQLKREEGILVEEKKLLESEKAIHQKELKRVANEDKSRFFPQLPLLNKKYLLQTLIGKGGFSEVWKAIDLQNLREVAVKIHQLHDGWNDSKKQAYIRHVTREYKIHKEMMHPRVVQLHDVFEIDVNSFATVLEYCRGTDLDEKLKSMKVIPEKDARTIVLQIASGLRYLNNPHAISSPFANIGDKDKDKDAKNNDKEKDEENNAATSVTSSPINHNNHLQTKKKSIIHFDLKPANILFDEYGDVKITDFGLSKILNENDEGFTSMELTSQGAGTYWYLPPECFMTSNGQPVMISDKVDVWSLGVIFYQMLYGKRPFGEGKSQEAVLHEGIMLNATQVDFGTNDPKAAKISDEAKDFIAACLTYDQKHRPDVVAMCQHPYLRSTHKKMGS